MAAPGTSRWRPDASHGFQRGGQNQLTGDNALFFSFSAKSASAKGALLRAQTGGNSAFSLRSNVHFDEVAREASGPRPPIYQFGQIVCHRIAAGRVCLECFFFYSQCLTEFICEIDDLPFCIFAVFVASRAGRAGCLLGTGLFSEPASQVPFATAARSEHRPPATGRSPLSDNHPAHGDQWGRDQELRRTQPLPALQPRSSSAAGVPLLWVLWVSLGWPIRDQFY